MMCCCEKHQGLKYALGVLFILYVNYICRIVYSKILSGGTNVLKYKYKGFVYARKTFIKKERYIMTMKRNISKALAMAVMMSVLAGGSAYAAGVTVTGGLDSSTYADPANSPGVIVTGVLSTYGKANYGYDFIQFEKKGKLMTIGAYGINLFSDNSLGISNMADGVETNDAVNKGQMESADADTLKKQMIIPIKRLLKFLVILLQAYLDLKIRLMLPTIV